MEKKRDRAALVLEVVCWIALLGAEFFFLLSFLPWKFLWVFLFLTLLILAFAICRRALWKQKIFLRITGAVLAVLSLTTGWVCFSDAAQAAGDIWWTDDLADYDHLEGYPFPGSKDERDIFPYPIPEYASETKFHYNVPFLQGGMIEDLSFCVPPEYVETWEAFFQEKADYPGSYLDQGLTAHDMTDKLGFPSEYKTYVIYAGNSLDGDNPSLDHYPGWNHGEVCYGAINTRTNRVYFYESDW